jgi:hypothetical protein
MHNDHAQGRGPPRPELKKKSGSARVSWSNLLTLASLSAVLESYCTTQRKIQIIVPHPEDFA